MNRPQYLTNYLFEWELLEVVLNGKSALDSKFFIGPISSMEEVESFLKGYGIDPVDPIAKAELFGNFQEAIQFIKKYFLKEGNPDGLDLSVPNGIYMITDIRDLFLMATGHHKGSTPEETLWAEVILKVMHTILHADKDLRSNYFPIIQTQIFDQFYKYVFRDEENNLNLGVRGEFSIPLLDFETKSKKTRESVIIKLLHKAENVAEEVFDRIGVRIITKNKFDILRVLKFLIERHIVIPHNNKPSRSMNTIFDVNKFKEKHNALIKTALRSNLSEEKFLDAVETEINECSMNNGADRNNFTSNKYQSVQFTCRQLIKYKNPFLQEFRELRKLAKEVEAPNELSQKILGMDVALISRDIRFFYPYEIQILDIQSHKTNTEGEASHLEYKKSQVQAAMRRVFGSLIKFKNIQI
ncbi:MAG: hypothetical protein COW00_06530 [Bdellovibrio sp. CG12_big_fil_rev_8_21_14_0_65_39_13]|nr:MAG: hypothetical protein COW78_19065 [Bdellovibrio sp. CG22_combo_CG10-13_8_21_14_all_39_27]PIQ60877.1 MAG: hypothetical protein COW00_06530 [Bdellovibrio sp. CG12_big_fil_rev_8_21_14_0_65_39_13]PIR36501.1 MAG: hypothetical protein COV37_03875 [Bdellovibrio sp. CG11_big_fil_rev_8_21_14_0_20_39_38]PJB52519.1 MAG: hypothetical protein CO099_12210 [Bdellovibrio sp. CG_4_9_14_3_um_filter_39_7]